MDAAGAEQVEEAVADCVRALGAVADRDWRAVRAGRLEWDCRRTAEHIAEDLITYAGQLAGRAADAYVPFEIVLDDGTDNAGALHVIRTTGALLAATLRTTPRAVRAFHPYPFRHADRTGFAAMGVAEVLLHTHDVTEGLGVAYEPPAALAEFVLTRIFPEVMPGPAPWPTLLWATGRGDLPGREPVTAWRWSNNLVVPAGRLTLEGVTPAAAAGLAVGGSGGVTWADPGPYDGTPAAAGAPPKAYGAGVRGGGGGPARPGARARLGGGQEPGGPGRPAHPGGRHPGRSGRPGGGRERRVPLGGPGAVRRDAGGGRGAAQGVRGGGAAGPV